MQYIERHPEITVLGTCGYTLDVRHPEWSRPIRKPLTDAEIVRTMRWENPFIHSSVMFRKDVIVKAGGYDPRYRYCCDFALWRKLARAGCYNFANLDLNLQGYRVHHRDSLTARYPIRRFTEQLRLLWDYPL